MGAKNSAYKIAEEDKLDVSKRSQHEEDKEFFNTKLNLDGAKMES